MPNSNARGSGPAPGKVLMNKDYRNYNAFKSRVATTVAGAKGVVDDRYTGLVERGLKKIDEIVEIMKSQLGDGNLAAIFSDATVFPQSMHMLVLAWLHLESLTIALPKMKSLLGDLEGAGRDKVLADNSEAAYYFGRVLSSPFYINAEFPRLFGKAECMTKNETAPIMATSDAFSGALAGE